MRPNDYWLTKKTYSYPACTVYRGGAANAQGVRRAAASGQILPSVTSPIPILSSAIRGSRQRVSRARCALQMSRPDPLPRRDPDLRPFVRPFLTSSACGV